MPTQARPLTAEGTILGTFQYMAPEQLEGVEADARTDIFALGAVLYEAATRRRAFEGTNKTSLIAAIVTGRPAPISSLQPLTPPAFERVVQKYLEKDRDDRWQSAHDVASELFTPPIGWWWYAPMSSEPTEFLMVVPERQANRPRLMLMTDWTRSLPK